MPVSIKFGTYDLQSGSERVVSDFKINSNNRVKSQIIPYKDGAHIDEALLNPLTVSIKGSLYKSSQSALRTAKDEFLKAICEGKQNLYLWDDRYALAQKKSLNYDYKAAMLYMPYSLTLIADTPFWVAVSASQDVEVVSSSPHQYAVTMNGSAYAKPKITFTANQGSALSNISFENITADEKFGYAGSVSIGNSLVIDYDKFTVENNGVDDIANFSGDFLRMTAGSNTLKYTGQNCTITIDWYDRWF